ncbi:MAG: N-acetylmuramoyl-L-alanine amidase, partial [uncultured Chthoniobacterales bacterium]
EPNSHSASAGRCAFCTGELRWRRWRAEEEHQPHFRHCRGRCGPRREGCRRAALWPGREGGRARRRATPQSQAARIAVPHRDDAQLRCLHRARSPRRDRQQTGQLHLRQHSLQPREASRHPGLRNVLRLALRAQPGAADPAQASDDAECAESRCADGKLPRGEECGVSVRPRGMRVPQQPRRGRPRSHRRLPRDAGGQDRGSDCGGAIWFRRLQRACGRGCRANRSGGRSTGGWHCAV